MSDVFGFAVAAAGDFLRDAAIEAGYELGLFDGPARTLDQIADANGIGKGRWRLGALLDVLVALGALVRRADDTVRRADDTVRRADEAVGRSDARAAMPAAGSEAAVRLAARLAPWRGVVFERGAVPPRPTVLPRTGWRAMVDVFRRDKALDVEGGEIELRYHRHLIEVGAAAARELAPLLDGARLLDLGAGAGTFTAALLDERPSARATVVDFHEVIALAREHLARFGERVAYVPSAIETSQVEAHDVALLANVVHLHAPEWARRIVAAAAERVAPGGQVVIKDLRLDADRRGPLSGLMFALNMAIYTGGGSVYAADELRDWLEAAGLVAVEERRLAASPDSIVMLARKPPWLPRPLRRALAHAATTRPDLAPALEQHYRVTMPALRAVALARESIATAVTREAPTHDSAREPTAGGRKPNATEPTAVTAAAGGAREPTATEPNAIEPTAVTSAAGGAREPTAVAPTAGCELLTTELDWARLPRMRDAIGRLFAICAEHDARVPIAGAATATELFVRTGTLAQLYARTHYGGCMPLLYGYPADLAYFMSRGLDVHATIDRYLVAPILHELCHFAPERDALPPHLDECIAGWLAVHVWPEFAYPAAGCDDAIYAAPWLAQVGQAFARRFGIGPIVRAHSGAVTWRDALPADFVTELERVAWADWDKRGTLHFLSDTFDPEPWLALALGDARRGRGAGAVVDDIAFDRAIVGDALRAMCLATERVDGSFRTRARVPEAAITIDVATSSGAHVSTARHTEHDVQSPRYWLPASVAAAIRARGHAGYELYIGSIEVIPAVVATLCDGVPPKNFSLVPRSLDA